ncbi:MAG: 16S rRNA (cytosine(1402)-N(4))-methyltransferase, partial [Sphingomonadales bacterium]|nr:16S rRNA (cytosine(1402)-N(4))-methyltransferase [Sphingomonadales bacterium]
MTLAAAAHVPVLLAEVIEALAITPGETHVDGTFGAGGYSAAMLKAGAKVHAFDQDPDAIANGQNMVVDADGNILPHDGVSTGEVVMRS